MNVNEKQIREIFYRYCRYIAYTPSIFEDDIWNYLMKTVGTYFNTDVMYKKFCDVLKLYDYNIEAFEKEHDEIKDRLINVLTKAYNSCDITEEDYEKYHSFMRFNYLKDGTYLTIDLRNAHIQCLCYYGVLTAEDIDNVFSVSPFGKILQQYKWYYSGAYNFCRNNHVGFILSKKLLHIAYNSDDPFFKKIKEYSKTFQIVGDRMFIKIKEEDINLFEEYLYKDYETIDGIRFSVDICNRRTIKFKNFPRVFVDDSHCACGKFYANLYTNTVNYDLYPQIYKILKKEPIEKYDLAFGYDDDINYFIEQLRET